jgi:cysteine desulfurase/selenocysteine lyase
MALLDYKKIKQDFPILQGTMNGKPLVFLDSAASSQKPNQVIDVFSDFYRCRNANIHRGAYRLSYEATDLYDSTRTRLARFLNAPEPESIIFTRNTTESINLVAYAWGEENIEEGDEILVSELEHHSNLVPWIMLAQRKRARLRHIPLTDDLCLDYDRLDEVVNGRTRMIAIGHMSNAIGTINDLKRLSAKAKSVGAAFLVDGAQGACHLKVDVQDIGCDFYALSAHKMLGPTGVGALYGRKEILHAMPPFLGGGDMILSVRKDSFEPAPLPSKFEAGTPNIAGVIAFHNALDYLDRIGLDRIHEHETELLKYAMDSLDRIPGVVHYGTRDLSKRGCVLSFNVEGVHPHDVGSVLDEEGIAIRAGHHCVEPLMRSLEISGTARASFYLYNGPEDVDALVAGISKVREIFKSVVKR